MEVEQKLNMSLDEVISSGRPGGGGGGGGGGGAARNRGQKRGRDVNQQSQQQGGTVRVARRVYVGNLSFRTSWQDLKDHFREVGNGAYACV